MMREAVERDIHRVFELGILLKGAHAAIEIVTGLVLALVSTQTISGWVKLVTSGEIAEDPHDFIATSMLQWASTFSLDSKSFYAWYLLSHGVIKIVLVVALLRNASWAYPVSLVVLGLFIAYQVYRYTIEPSLGLVLLTAFDAVIIALIWHEYRLVLKHLPLA